MCNYPNKFISMYLIVSEVTMSPVLLLAPLKDELL